MSVTIFNDTTVNKLLVRNISQITKDTLAIIGYPDNEEAFTATIHDLVQQSGVSFSGSVAGIAKINTLPASGATPESQVIYFAGPGTYANFPDGADPAAPIVLTENLNVISWDGTKATVQPVPIDVDMEHYALSGGSTKTLKELDDDQVKDYQFKYFIKNIQIPNFTLNGETITDEILKRRILIRIEKAITKFQTFKLLKGKYLILSQFTFTPGGAISIGISVANSESEDVGFNASYTKFFQSLTPTDNMARFKMSVKANSMRFNILLDIDTNLMGSDKISLNTQNNESNVTYSRSGILTQNIQDIYTYKSFWGRDYLWFANAGGTSSATDRIDNINAYNAIQDIQIISNDAMNDRLLQLHQLSYTNGAITLIIWSCIDDDPSNLEVTTNRNGFRYHRAQIPITDTGLRKYVSFPASGTGDPELTVTILVDNDILHEGIADLTTFDARTGYFTAQYLVKKKDSGSVNPDGHYTQLRLLSSEDIEIYKWRWNSSGSNYSAGSGNKYKLCAIPMDGITNLVFNGTLDGADSNVLIYDKNFHAIEFVYDGGEGVINTLSYTPPADAAFFRVISASEMEVLANGDFTINTSSIKEYRSIHAGLADKFSGKIFSVAGKLFWKNKEGICDLREYSTSDDGYLNTLPTLESDNTLIVPTDVMHTDGVTPFNGGYLCNVKDGVMYFQNEHEQAVFISEDDGESYTTLFDSFSHPDIFNLGAGEISLLNNRPGIIVMNNGELLISIKSAGGLIDDPRKERREVYYRIYRTVNNRSDLVQCFKFSYESSLNDWDPAKPLWGNWVTGGILSKYSYDIMDNLVVITEYGAATPKWWANQGTDKNGNGVVGRAWISFDYGVTFKKFFDADRKKIGTSEDDDNWFYWNSKYNRMQMHPHSIRIDKTRRMIAICNGDGDDFIFEVSIDNAKAWYDTAPAVDPDAKPVYAETDTFPEWSTFQTNYDSTDPRIFVSIYSGMTGQLMSVVSTGFGYACMHDARRDVLFARYKNTLGEVIFEPVFWFEQMEDYPTQADWLASWVTEAFVQDEPKHEGIIYMVHTGGNGRPARIWATVNGITCKKLYEGTGLIGFGAALNFDRGNVYLSPKVGATSVQDGYYKLSKVLA